ncbi:MAG: hypothetical protein HQL69_12775 [Magnetococcales bacterium]|nr:hypothetical protein [Magnetococcales bacterium]
MDSIDNSKISMAENLADNEIPPHHLVLISAAVFTFLGRVEIKSISQLTQAGSPWARAGRKLLHRNSPNR